jgi:hypothetical protein
MSINTNAYLISIYFLDFLLSTHCTDELIDLSERWMQPIQQQGRRLPSMSSETVRSTWFLRVAACLTVVVQHIHSLRASGVISSQAFNAFGAASSALRISAGSLWLVPSEIFVVIPGILHGYGLHAVTNDVNRRVQRGSTSNSDSGWASIPMAYG